MKVQIADNNYILIGGGKHAYNLNAILLNTDAYYRMTCVGFLDTSTDSYCAEKGLNYLGNDEIIPYIKETFNAERVLLAVGKSVKTARRGQALFEIIKSNRLNLFDLKAEGVVYTNGGASFGIGVHLLTGCKIGVNARINDNVTINTGAIIEHDVIIGAHSHIAPGAVICGSCEIGERCFIGAGAIVADGIKIGNDCIIGAGAVVIRDVLDNQTVVGNPARAIGVNE